jgi:hypothetical protein
MRPIRRTYGWEDVSPEGFVKPKQGVNLVLTSIDIETTIR